MDRWLTTILFVVVLSGSSIPRLQAQRTLQSPTPTPATDLRSDSCERNDTPAEACVLTLDRVHGPYSFIPRGDQDYYSVDLGSEPTGLATEITVRGTNGLDLRTTITAAGTRTPIATFSSPTISATLPISLMGWLVVRVENRSPQVANWETYSIELRQQLPPAPTLPSSAHPGATPQQPPDLLEDNYDIDHAAPIAIGTIYDLSFTCPASWPGACAGGDHDYVTFPTKARSKYLIATFDLQTTDTVLDLYWGDRQAPLATNDDAYPPDEARRIPGGFASVLRWVAPADGWAIVRIGPRMGGTAPIVADEKAGAYRFAVALVGSALATQIEQRLAEQAGVPPTPTPVSVQPKGTNSTRGAPSSGSGSALPTAPAPSTSSSNDVRPGPAIVQAAATTLYTAPNPRSETLQTIPQATRVQLKGQIVGVWVRVEVAGGIAPGWVDSRHLRRLDTPAGDDTSARDVSSDDARDSAGVASGEPLQDAHGRVLPPGVTSAMTPTPRAITRGHSVRVEAQGPAPTPTIPLIVPEARVLTIEICAGHGGTTPCTTPLAGVRVELVHAATRAVLIAGRTDPQGQLRLAISVPPKTGVLLHLPILGVRYPLHPGDTTLPIRLPVPEGT